MTDPAGLDLASLQRWIEATGPAAVAPSGPLTAEVIAGGKSNLTYRVTDGRQTWVLRRPPLGHVLPTAHDMGREFRVISALHGTAVPVAPPLALCTDPEVLGAPFYLMGFVDGVVLDHQRTVDAIAPDGATSIGEILIDTLVALHAVDLAAVGLEDFGRPAGFVGRQVERWHRQSLASAQAPRDLEERAAAALRAALPADGPPAVVHGDYRLTNVILTTDRSAIGAVVDWEMATVGDPLTDVGLLYVYHHTAERTAGIMPHLDHARGWLTADQLLARYAGRTGRDVTALQWYVAFGFYKLAVIAEGIAARHAQGLTVGAGFAHFADLVPVMLEQSLTTLREGVH